MRSMSYQELFDTGDFAKIEQLIDDGLLDDATLKRCAHIRRFFERLSEIAIAKTPIGGEGFIPKDDLDRIWAETADPDATPEMIGFHPPKLR